MINKTTLLFAALLSFWSQAYSQDLYTLRSGRVHFFAGTPVEDIEAVNTKTTSFMNIKTGEVIISMPNKEFHFKKALMEEHFNENYMESEKFPKSEFKGKIADISSYDFTKTEPLVLSVEGVLTVHGVAKQRTIRVTVISKNGVLEAETKFQIALADHNIERPKILWEKLADKVDVTVNFTYAVYKK